MNTPSQDKDTMKRALEHLKRSSNNIVIHNVVNGRLIVVLGTLEALQPEVRATIEQQSRPDIPTI